MGALSRAKRELALCQWTIDMSGDRLSHRSYTLEDGPRGFGVGDLEPKLLVQRHNQLEGIHRVQAEAARAEQSLRVADFVGVICSMRLSTINCLMSCLSVAVLPWLNTRMP